MRIWLIFIIVAVLFYGSFRVLHNSFAATIISMLTGIVIILIQRKDLLSDSLITGVLVTFSAALISSIINLITPGWIDEFYHFKNVPHIIFMGLSLDDLVWYFLVGAFIGPLYEYWQEGRLMQSGR